MTIGRAVVGGAGAAFTGVGVGAGGGAGAGARPARVRVVAAVLQRASGEVLIAQRPPGKPLSGRWEFPGGKVGAGESDAEALRRELAEELGVEIERCHHLMDLHHDYPDRSITLSTWVVERYRGEPRGMEGQSLKWVAPAALGNEDILEADRPLLGALQSGAWSARPSSSGESFAVRNPWTGAVDHHFRAPSRIELERRLYELRAAQRGWSAAGLTARIETLARWRAALLARAGELQRAVATDTGRTRLAHTEIQSVVRYIDRWSRLAPTLAQEEEGRSFEHPSLSYRSQYVPYSLVGVISPWNFPLTLACIDAIPALLAGAAVYIKPSEITPRFVEPLMRSIADVPELAAVLRVAPGGRETGIALIELVDLVCFTGSVRTGRLVAEQAARAFIPAFLELGGKDPLVVTASADLELATDVALRGSCTATGQACQSLERLYVHASLFEAFVRRLVEKSERVAINWPDPRQGTLGPFIWGPQADIVADQIADAKARGARVLCGGVVEDHGGKWLRPTVMVDVDHTMAIMSEETFGPVMPVMPWNSVEEALALANAGEYGLSAGVIAGTLEEAEAIGRHIDAGGVSLNDGSLTGLMHEADKHSFKASGLGGSRMGGAGYTRFFRKKVLIRQTGRPASIDEFGESSFESSFESKFPS
jgi:mutator protein MutT